MGQIDTSERHVETVAWLDVIGSAALAGLAAWLLGGLASSVNPTEHGLRISVAIACGVGAFLGLVLWAALERRSGFGRGLHLLAAVLALPLVPFGTAWGGYAWWVLTRPGTRARFGSIRMGRSTKHGADRPYWGALVAATAICGTTIALSAIKVRELWLETQVADAAGRAAERQEAISRRVEQLRENGVLDSGEEPPRRVRR